MDTKEMQRLADEWISQFEEGYWEPMTMLAVLTEEVGEFAREVNHRFGQKPKKNGAKEDALELELGDILFVLTSFANSQELDIGEAFAKAIEKYWARDLDRWTKKDKGE